MWHPSCHMAYMASATHTVEQNAYTTGEKAYSPSAPTLWRHANSEPAGTSGRPDWVTAASEPPTTPAAVKPAHQRANTNARIINGPVSVAVMSATAHACRHPAIRTLCRQVKACAKWLRVHSDRQDSGFVCFWPGAAPRGALSAVPSRHCELLLQRVLAPLPPTTEPTESAPGLESALLAHTLRLIWRARDGEPKGRRHSPGHVSRGVVSVPRGYADARRR